MHRHSRLLRYLMSLFYISILYFMPSDSFSQNKMNYANHLMNEQDYYRAISEFKKLYYFSNNIEIKNECLLDISRAYLKSNKFKLSIKYSANLLNQPNIDIHQRNKANNYIGLGYYGLKVFSMAEDYFNKTVSSDTTGYSLFYLSLIDVEKGKYKKASLKFSNIAQKYPKSQLSGLSNQLSGEVLEGLDIKRKNSSLATFLSTIFPGSGQIYCAHYYDGIQAFIYVGAFAFATFASYRYDKNYNNNYITTYLAISITSLFHIGNIIGANRTAKYFNLKHQQNFLNNIREKVFSLDFL